MATCQSSKLLDKPFWDKSKDPREAELRFLRHPGIQDARKNMEKVGRSVYNVTYFVTKCSIERIESIKVDGKIILHLS